MQKTRDLTQKRGKENSKINVPSNSCVTHLQSYELYITEGQRALGKKSLNGRKKRKRKKNKRKTDNLLFVHTAIEFEN